MTPPLSAVIDQTIRLQEQTNHFQLLSLGLILICDVLIFLSVLNIRRVTRVNREWSAYLKAWSEALSAAQGIEAQSATTAGRGPKDESPVGNADASN